MMSMRSRLIRFGEQHLQPVVAHEGRGEVLFKRVLTREQGSALDFVDMTLVPPGCSVGLHTHADAEEEHYFVFEGRGTMSLAGERIQVQAGDLIVNEPGGTHSLENPGPGPLRMIVWQARHAR